MKLSFKIILPIMLISALLILLTGCISTVPDDNPGYTPGTITGIIAAPCCPNSGDTVTETCCVPPEFWCYYCTPTWNLKDGIEVVLTYGEDEVATTTTNEDGEFTFTDLAPGKNYVVTAYCPDYSDNRPLVKDVALEVAEGGSFDTFITDLVSTSLGLVVDFLVQYTDWGPEDISLDAVLADRPDFPNFPKFKALIYEVRRVLENCELNLLTDDDVQYATCRAAEEISGLEIGCGPGETGGEGEGEDECLNNLLPVIDSVSINGDEVNKNDTVNVILEESYDIVVNAHDQDNKLGTLTYHATTANGVESAANTTGQVTVTPTSAGTYQVYVYVYDGCDEISWGPVTVVVNCCPLDPILDIDIDIIQANKSSLSTLCLDWCAVIKSVTVNYTNGTTPPLVITNLNDASLFWNWDASKISFNQSSGLICLVGGLAGTPGTYAISVLYTNQCKVTASASVNITFADCNPTYTLTMAVSPAGAGTTVPSIGAHSGYAKDFVESISASANAGYHFVNWTVNTGAAVAAPGSASTKVVVDVNKTVTAHFEKDDPCLNNRAPIIGTIPSPQKVVQNHWYHYTVPASDPDSDVLLYELTSNPSGMIINSSTGYISWWASCGSSCDINLEVNRCRRICTKSVTVKVTDPCGKTAEKTFSIEVWDQLP